jgi:hypothetical protein
MTFTIIKACQYNPKSIVEATCVSDEGKHVF